MKNSNFSLLPNDDDFGMLRKYELSIMGGRRRSAVVNLQNWPFRPKPWHKTRIYLGSFVDPEFRISGIQLYEKLYTKFTNDITISVFDRYFDSMFQPGFSRPFATWISANLKNCRMGYDPQISQKCLIFDTAQDKEEAAGWLMLQYPEIVRERLGSLYGS